MFFVVLFAVGALGGCLVEYTIHRFLHAYRIKLHADHHKEFFLLEPAQVAKNSHPMVEYSIYAAIVLVALSPLIFLLGFYGFLALYGGVFFHLMGVYQISHFALHDDSFLPQRIRSWRWYKWWRDCHTEHHWHKPAKNLCVTCPFIDMVFGTYVKPRGSYRATPVRRNEKQK